MDASTLTVTSLNVGMNAEDSFKSSQGQLLKKLAGIIVKWLAGPGDAAVALNELHARLAEKLMHEIQLKAPAMNIQKETSYSHSLLWRAPQ